MSNAKPRFQIKVVKIYRYTLFQSPKVLKNHSLWSHTQCINIIDKRTRNPVYKVTSLWSPQLTGGITCTVYIITDQALLRKNRVPELEGGHRVVLSGCPCQNFILLSSWKRWLKSIRVTLWSPFNDSHAAIDMMEFQGTPI